LSHAAHKAALRAIATRPPPPVIPKSNAFLDFDNAEVARQLCLYEQYLYNSVHPSEFLNQSWHSRKENAPNLVKTIEYFNNITNWITTQIVTQGNEKDRIKMIRKFIKIMSFASKYNNFSTLREVCAAFQSSAVWRLKATWAQVERDKKIAEEHQRIRALLEPRKNFKTYREALQKANPPCLPYLGQFLSDLTFIEDGNKDYLILPSGRTDIINVEKMGKIATIIHQICLYQQHSYSFEKVDIIYQFFSSPLEHLSEKENYEKSREIEPPNNG